jgi:hypothetical protein
MKHQKGVVEMADVDEKIIFTIDHGGKIVTTESPISAIKKIVIVINNQITSSPNTTQIASGSGRNSAAGNNAAIDSSNTLQQQGVGAQGHAKNNGMKGDQIEPHAKHEEWKDGEELVIIINNQIHEAAGESSATQVASGGGTDSTGGTNAAIQSSNTKQQHAVGGDQSGFALNSRMDSQQKEIPEEDSGNAADKTDE